MRTINTSTWQTWHVVAAVVLTLLGIVLTREAWMDIYAIAEGDPEQSHVWLVPLVALWMFWARRARLRNVRPGGTFVGPVIVGVGFLMSTLGYQYNLGAVWHLGAVAIVVGCLLTILGKNVLFQFFPAFAVLAFLVPVPGIVRSSLSLPLQKATAWITQALLETMGFMVERSENLLRINGQDVAVAEACNGMRMVMALLLVSYAFAFSLPFRNSTRLIILILSPVAALVCNVIRLVPTVLVYGYWSTAAGDKFHDISGWVMLPVAFFLLMGVHKLLRWALLPVMRYNLAYE